MALLQSGAVARKAPRKTCKLRKHMNELFYVGPQRLSIVEASAALLDT